MLLIDGRSIHPPFRKFQSLKLVLSEIKDVIRSKGLVLPMDESIIVQHVANVRLAADHFSRCS